MGARKRVIGIALLTALAVLGDSMLFIVLPVYWREMGLTAIWQIGVLLSVNRFIRLPVNPLIGIFYKYFSLRTGLLIALFLAVVSTFSYGVLTNFWLLFLMRILWGIAWSFLRLGGYLTVIEVSDSNNRGNLVGLYNGLWGLGGLVGMFGGGLLIDQTSIFFVTALFATMGITAFPLLFLFVPKVHSETSDRKNAINTNALSSYVWMVLLTGLTMGFIVFGLFAATLSQLIDRSFTENWTFLNVTVGAATIAGVIQAVRWSWDPFVASYFGKVLDSAKSKIRLLYVPLVGGGMLLFFMGFTQTLTILVLLLLIFQLMSTMFVTTTDTLATNAAGEANSIKIITLHTIVVDVGAALGPLMAYIVIQHFNLTVAYIFSSVIMLILLIAWFSYNKIAKR
ncbi:MFS transporter [Virgibacillus doumboii]|uniref:MFS transporter n=1 Tax=Virgibacillus doumboii TaxID=2697503 RepID=UPI0013DF72AD|nr:MFS transporter [Virgibacillus doumboii]